MIFLLFESSNSVGADFRHGGVPVVDGDSGLAGGDADGVGDPPVDRVPHVKPVAGGVCDEDERALVRAGAGEQLQMVTLLYRVP